MGLSPHTRPLFLYLSPRDGALYELLINEKHAARELKRLAKLALTLRQPTSEDVMGKEDAHVRAAPKLAVVSSLMREPAPAAATGIAAECPTLDADVCLDSVAF